MMSPVPVIAIWWTVFGFTLGLVEKPKNVAGVIGSNLQLTCKGTASETILLWQRSNPVQPESFYAVSGTRYNTNWDYGTKVSVLTINNLQQEDGGTYACKSGATPTDIAYSQVVVIAEVISCNPNKALTGLPSGDTLETSCSISFFGATDYAPTIAWAIPFGAALTAVMTKTSSRVTSTYQEEILCSYTGRQYQVDVTFPPFLQSWSPNPSWDHAANPASYAYRLTTDPMSVICRLTKATISPKKNIYRPGETLRCAGNADASPSINFVWIGMELSATGPTFTISQDMLDAGQIQVECMATQTSNGRSFTASDSNAFTVSAVGSGSPVTVQTNYAMTSLTAAILLHAIVAANMNNI